jgi:CBS domain-containing membrane protein
MDALEVDINRIAEYADSSIRATVPAPAAGPRKGSLPAIKARKGFNSWLYRHWGNRGNAVYTAIGSLFTIGISGLVAWGLNEPFLFPSLGATAFLMFETPMAEVSSTRNAVIGHMVGAAVAFFWLWVFGLIDMPSAIQAGFDSERVAAIALSLAFTGGILRLLRAAHPPAGATTVIVALGLLDNGHQMWILFLGVLLVVIPAGIINRLMGVPAPLWSGTYSGFFNGIRKAFGGGGKKRAPQVATGPTIFLGAGPPLFGAAGTAPGQLGIPSGESVQPPAYAADWYPDPLGRARMRYWDGSRWTDQTSE